MSETVISAGEPIIQLTENGLEGFEVLCRLCANRSDHLISIYSEEGVSNGLADKMNLYLPVKVAKSDTLPLQCCYQCASTVLTWHELMVASVEADRRLRNIQHEVEKQLAVHAEPGPSQEVEKPPNERPTNRAEVSLNPFRPATQPKSTTTSAAAVPAILRRRGRPIKPRPPPPPSAALSTLTSSEVKLETSPPPAAAATDLTTDGDWIKTELVLEADEVNPFIADCQLTEEPSLKLSPATSASENGSDFDELDPEYDPGDESEYEPKKTQQSCANCPKTFRKASELRKHLKQCAPALKEELVEQDEDFGDEKKKFKREYRCDYCPALLVRKGDLKKHIQSLHPDKFESFSDKRQKRRSKIDQEAVNRAKVVVDSRTYYHCDECGKNLHSPYTYIWHNRIHTGERPFVCDLCGKQFRVSQGLVRHLRETHAGIKNFPCDLCGRMFATRRNVEEHRRIHTNERPYICDLCGKAFKQKASLFVHNRSHTDSFPYKCSYCNQGFRTRPPLLVHVTRHTGEKPYACDICGRCFRIKYELKRHRLIHSDDKPFSCAECGLSFRQKRYLRNHNKINHKRATLTKPHDSATLKHELDDTKLATNGSQYCQLCLLKFPTQATYAEHNESVHYKCQKCCRVFQNGNELECHVNCELSERFSSDIKQEEPELVLKQSADECDDSDAADVKVKSKRSRRKKCEIVAQHFCDICQKGFTRRHDMKKHRAKQHATVPELVKNEPQHVELLRKSKVVNADGKQVYKCDVCGKLIHHSYDFVRHQTIHTGVRPYFCHICGKNYRMASTLNRHIKELHYRIKRFTCEQCGRKFAAKAALEDHKNIHTNARPFICDVCGKSFKQKSSLYIHKLFHANNLRFSCTVCGKGYRRARDLKVHSWLHTGHRPYACETCGSMFRLSQDLKRHLKVHEKSSAECVCAECGASFTQVRYLNNHRKIHEDSTEFRDKNALTEDFASEQALFLCDVCSHLCTGKTQFELHTREHAISCTAEDTDDTCRVTNDTVHLELRNETSNTDSGGHLVYVDGANSNPEQLYVFLEPNAQEPKLTVTNSERTRYECEICEKVFNRYSNLNAHLTSHTRDLACYVCCNSFASPFKLDQHMTQHSEQHLAECKDSPAVVQCALCTEVFYSKLALYEHKKVHQNLVEYSCDECAKKFNTYRQLVSHKKRHARSAICSVCGKVYSSDKVLTQHLRLHSGEKPYECAVCKMRFRFQSGLIVHERVHTGERNYKCGQCSKTFARSNYLKEHMRIHFNEKPFKCEFCEAMFTQKNVLKTHLAKKHRQCWVCEQNVGDALQLRMHIWKVHPELHAGLDESVVEDIG